MSDEKCKKCGTDLVTYYGKRCPKCIVPQVHTVREINLFEVLDHLEAIGHKGIKDRIWDYLCSNENVHNNILIIIYMPTKEDNDPESFGSKKEDYKDLKILSDFIYSIGEDPEKLYWDISW